MRNYWSLKLNETLAAFCIACLPLCAAAQLSNEREAFSKTKNNETYIYPINPGQPGSLAGTMGELRSTHFHSGIDIRTNNMIGFPVRASKSGYISRAGMGGSGYGNVLYVTHPDGNTTVYGHLDEFKGQVAKHVLQEQYKLKSGEIDLFFQKNQFAVKQGDTIALSGNSGGSTGPHLHFEIRDSNNYALDPLKMGVFKRELVDKYPPSSEKIALVTLSPTSRINDRFGRYEFYGRKVGSNFVIANPILASGLIGIEIIAKDKLADKSPFFGGVNFLEVWVDSAMVFRQAIDKLNISETRTIYTLMDFKAMRSKGTRFYKLYIDDGNDLKFYQNSPASGKIKVNPSKLSTIKIKMTDSNSNSSTLTFKLKPTPVVQEVASLEPMTTDVAYDITDNTLMVSAKAGKDLGARANVYTKGVATEQDPTYYNANRKVYLFDLRKSIPDSVRINNKTIRTNIRIAIPSGTEYTYYGDPLDIQFPLNALYDTLYLNTSYALDKWNNEMFTIGTRTVPINKSITVSIRPKKVYPPSARYHVYRSTGKAYSFIGGERVNERIQFNTREFGDFTILKDTIPPTIAAIAVNNQAVRFKIRDNLSGIASFEALLNGEWLLMHYDSKSATIWSERMDKSVAMRGDFRLTVKDNAGNTSTFTQKIP